MKQTTFIHWRLSVPHRPSITQDRHFQRALVQVLSQLKTNSKARFYACFYEHFQFHLMAEISPRHVSSFETKAHVLLNEILNHESPDLLRFKVLDLAALKESSSEASSFEATHLLSAPEPQLTIKINPKHCIHRFQIIRGGRTIWPQRRELLARPLPLRGFFTNPMQSVRA